MKRLFTLFAFLPLVAISGFAAKAPYQYFRVGNPENITTRPRPGTVLMGGGTDVDEAFSWMCAKSDGGDFLVIRATGTDAYNPWIPTLSSCQLSGGINSVATLIIPTRVAADNAFVADAINNAEAIFIAGGDQSDYINFWKGTKVQAALNAAIKNRGVPIGGTSAGLNVLTQFVYSALLSQGVTSSQALANPYSKYITLDRDFVSLPSTMGVIGDAHFKERDRMGRDLAFLCRLYKDFNVSNPSAIAVDAEAALVIEESGIAYVLGSNSAYLLQATGQPGTCEPKMPLTYVNVAVYRISKGIGQFSVSSSGPWSSTVSGYFVSALNGVLSSTQAQGAIY